jgi:hypothetical protein
VREDSLKTVGAECTTAASLSVSDGIIAIDRPTVNTQLDALHEASSPFPLELHCLMIGQNDGTAAASPVCEVRSSGETGTVLEMQRWLCDRHVRRELALLAKLLPSYNASARDESDSVTESAADNPDDVRDVSLEEWEPSSLSCMSRILFLGSIFSWLLATVLRPTHWKSTTDMPAKAASFYVDLCHRNIPRSSGLESLHLDPARNSVLGAYQSSGSDNDELSNADSRKRSYIYDCTRCHRTFTSSRRAEEHVVQEKCGGIVGKLVRIAFPCPCNAFRTDSEAGLRKHKQHCQGYGDWDPSNLPFYQVATPSLLTASDNMGNEDVGVESKRAAATALYSSPER